MTRVCGQCRVEGRETILGEKCPSCGEEARLFWAGAGTRLSGAGAEAWFECPNSRCKLWAGGNIAYIFPRGEGGVSHGLCEPCLAEARKELGGLATSTAVEAPK